MKRSISNLALADVEIEQMGGVFERVGITGMEIAPTVIWPEAPHIPPDVVRTYARRCRSAGIEVSGIQSLLFGHPEFQIFDRRSWPKLAEHLKSMIRLADLLDARIAVFGSPRNRLKGSLTFDEANKHFAEFLALIIPTLKEHGVTLTLEPNAPEYGADYLVDYSEVLLLTDELGTPWVQPQIDTGCLAMVGNNPADCALARMPAHIHVSAPSLAPPPGGIDHDRLSRALSEHSYEGWIVLEMLSPKPDWLPTIIGTCEWLRHAYP